MSDSAEGGTKQAMPTGRVLSISRIKSAMILTKPGESGYFNSSRSTTSLPALQTTTQGWLRSRLTKFVYCFLPCSGIETPLGRSAVLSHLSKHSSQTTMPMRSHRSSTSGAGGLWLVRRALTPIARMICNSRSIARVLNAIPSGPRCQRQPEIDHSRVHVVHCRKCNRIVPHGRAKKAP